VPPKVKEGGLFDVYPPIHLRAPLKTHEKYKRVRKRDEIAVGM
jgi:hypothetical protein